MGLAPDEAVHAAHRGADDQPGVIHAQAFGQQLVLGLDHVVVVVVGKARVQPIRRLGGLAVADAVREDHEIALRVEQAAGGQQHAGELRADQAVAAAAGAVQGHDRVDHMAGGVPAGRSEAGIVDPEFRQGLARAEMEIVDHEVALVGCGLRRGLRPGRGTQAEQGRCGQGCANQLAHSPFLQLPPGHHRWPSPTMC